MGNSGSRRQWRQIWSKPPHLTKVGYDPRAELGQGQGALVFIKFFLTCQFETKNLGGFPNPWARGVYGLHLAHNWPQQHMPFCIPQCLYFLSSLRGPHQGSEGVPNSASIMLATLCKVEWCKQCFKWAKGLEAAKHVVLHPTIIVTSQYHKPNCFGGHQFARRDRCTTVVPNIPTLAPLSPSSIVCSCSCVVA